MSFIQGYLATITIDGASVEIFASDATLSLTNETLDKTTLGVSNRQYITGLQDGSIDISMHLDTVGIVAMQGAYAKTVPVTFVFRPGELGTADAGQWSGSMIITELAVPGQVDDNWQMNISGQITGSVLYTAPV